MFVEIVMMGFVAVPIIGGIAKILDRNHKVQQKEKTENLVESEMEKALQYSRKKTAETKVGERTEEKRKKERSFENQSVKTEEMMEWYFFHRTRLEKDMINENIIENGQKSRYLIEKFKSWKNNDTYNRVKQELLQKTDKKEELQNGNMDENRLKEYLRSVCYRGEEPVFRSEEIEKEVEFRLSVEKNRIAPVYAICLSKNNYFQMRCAVDKATLSIKEIDFGNIGNHERFLARNYFEKVVKEYLPKEIKRAEEQNKKEIDDLWKMAKEIRKEKEKEKECMEIVNRKFQNIQRKIQELVDKNHDLSEEIKYKLNCHYLQPVKDMIAIYRGLILENKLTQLDETLESMKKVEDAIDYERESIDKEKIFELKKQAKIIKQRTSL